MIDVSSKPSTLRRARARAVLAARAETLERVRSGSVPKGDAIAMARAAATIAAKRTGELIPFCHPIPLDHVALEFDVRRDTVVIEASVTAVWKTGVEMEAMVAASTAALVLYDMLKPLDDGLEIRSVAVIEKRGGRSDREGALLRALRAAVVVTSDRAYAGNRGDEAGPLILAALRSHGIESIEYRLVPDDRSTIEETLRHLSDERRCDLIVTTGGTGLGPRDATVEAARAVFDRELPGVMEAARAFGQSRTPYAMLSRGVAGQRGATLLATLPGSLDGVRESLAALLPGLLHAFPIIRGEGHDDARAAARASEERRP